MVLAKPLDLGIMDVVAEKTKREMLSEEIEKAKQRYDESEILQVLNWLLTDSTVSQVVDIVTLKLKKEIRKQVRQACEFYLKYKDNPELLSKDYNYLNKKVLSFLKPLNEESLGYGSYWEMEKYNEWLFRLAFKDVLEEGL